MSTDTPQVRLRADHDPRRLYRGLVGTLEGWAVPGSFRAVVVRWQSRNGVLVTEGERATLAAEIELGWLVTVDGRAVGAELVPDGALELQRAA